MPVGPTAKMAVLQPRARRNSPLHVLVRITTGTNLTALSRQVSVFAIPERSIGAVRTISTCFNGQDARWLRSQDGCATTAGSQALPFRRFPAIRGFQPLLLATSSSSLRHGAGSSRRSFHPSDTHAMIANPADADTRDHSSASADEA
jgi:hypothetical protein